MVSLRILTLNCCLLPKFLFQSTGEDNREQRARLIHQLIQRYDLVLLQEVFSTAWTAQWHQIFKQVPEMTSVLTERGAGKLTDSGLVILSRYPIDSSSFTRFYSKSFTNSVVDRGFLYAVVKVGETLVHTINTHLNPSECHYGPRSAAEYRRRQVHEIQDFRASSGHADGQWVIGGDFNDESVVHTFHPLHITLAREKLPTSHDLVPFAIKNNGEHLCIDYIVTTAPQIYYRRMETLISDHYGVETAIDI